MLISGLPCKWIRMEFHRPKYSICMMREPNPKLEQDTFAKGPTFEAQGNKMKMRIYFPFIVCINLSFPLQICSAPAAMQYSNIIIHDGTMARWRWYTYGKGYKICITNSHHDSHEFNDSNLIGETMQISLRGHLNAQPNSLFPFAIYSFCFIFFSVRSFFVTSKFQSNETYNECFAIRLSSVFAIDFKRNRTPT